MTTQDTGLVDLAAGMLAARSQRAHVTNQDRLDVRAVLRAVLPHLSPESREIIEEELG